MFCGSYTLCLIIYEPKTANAEAELSGRHLLLQDYKSFVLPDIRCRLM